MAKYPPTYRKIDGNWYHIRTTWATKKEAQKTVDSWNKPKKWSGGEKVFSARLVKLAKSYRTKKRKYAVYYRGVKRGIVYHSGLPSPKNPMPKALKDFLIKRAR